MLEKIKKFLNETKNELKKVTWPGKKEVWASTLVSIILILIVAFFIGIVDFILSRILGILIK